MQENGNLNTCAYCQKPLRVTDGTDPDDASESFTETYECENGHTGRYKYDSSSGRVVERYSGACAEPVPRSVREA